VQGFGAFIKTEQLKHHPPPTMPYNQHYTTPQNASIYGAQLYVIADNTIWVVGVLKLSKLTLMENKHA
jgi:hypothetical protein